MFSFALKSFQCLENELERHECGRNNRELILDFIRSNTDDFFNVGCTDYTDSSDKCQQLKPPKPFVTNATNKRKQTNKNSRVYATPVFVMIDLMSTIGNSHRKRG